MSGQSSGDTAQRFRWQLRRTRSWLMNWRCSDAVFAADFGSFKVPQATLPVLVPDGASTPRIRRRQERFAFSSNVHGSVAAVLTAAVRSHGKAHLSADTLVSDLVSMMDGIGVDAGRRAAVGKRRRNGVRPSSATRDASAGGIFSHDNLLRRHARCGRLGLR
jgi:hypothetical protein